MSVGRFPPAFILYPHTGSALPLVIGASAIKSVIESSISEEGDPLEDQVLPRDEREQTRQYFDRLRDGV